MKNAWSRPLKPVSAPPGLSRNDTSNTNRPTNGPTSSTSQNSSGAGTGADDTMSNILRERFLHLTLNLLGQTVSLTLTDGSEIEGVFHTFTPFQMSGKNKDRSNKYVIKAARITKTKQGEDGKNELGTATEGTLIVSAEEVSQLLVKSIRLETANRSATAGNTTSNGDAFVTDTDISSGGAVGSDDLVMASSSWVTSDGGNGALESGGLGNKTDGNMGRKGMFGTKTAGKDDPMRGGIGEWDQFKANEAQFGVKATFDENLYTTSLDKNSVDRKQKLEAARMAREIEGQATTNMHLAEERGQVIEGDYDEEDRYSGVLVTGGEEAKQKERTKLVLKPRSADTGTNDSKSVKDTSGAKDSSAADETSKNAEGSTNTAAPKKMAWAAVVKKTDPTKPNSSPPKADKAEDEAVTVEDKTASAKKATTSDDKKDENEDNVESAEAKSEEKAKVVEEAKKDDGETEKAKPKSKLNAKAKSFSFNPSAKSFTPSFGTPAPPLVPVAPTNEAPHQMAMPMHPQFVNYPPMQPGGIPVAAPMMYQSYPGHGMRYGQSGAPSPYPGMMAQQQQGAGMQSPPPPPPGQDPNVTPPGPEGVPPVPKQMNAEDSEAGPSEVKPSTTPTPTPQDSEKGSESDQSGNVQAAAQNQPAGQGPPMPNQMGYPGGPGYYPANMAMHGGGRGPVQQHYHPQMVAPQMVQGRNYVYGVAPQHMHQGNMPQYNQMRNGPGGYPGGPPYMQGGYNPRPMDDDMGYRGGGGGRGRGGGRGSRRGGRGGRGGGGRGKYNANYNIGGGQGNQQQPQPSDNAEPPRAPQDQNE